jgi:hypothetical protein
VARGPCCLAEKSSPKVVQLHRGRHGGCIGTHTENVELAHGEKWKAQRIVEQ